MMEYEIIMEESAVVVQSRVRDYIEKGWQPQGGLVYSQGPGGRVVCQAMIKIPALLPPLHSSNYRTPMMGKIT